jgi:YidC/Oxa1 family membrane protein insertase
MNDHLLMALAQMLAIAGVMAVVIFALLAPMRAQARTYARSSLTPPQFAAAMRLVAEERYEDAAAALHSVENDPAYANTPYRPEAVYLRARLYRDRLHDGQHALALYNVLVTQYAGASFPHKSAVQTERQALWSSFHAPAAQPKPLYRFMDFFVKLTGARSYSYAFALLLLSALSRLMLWPFMAGQARNARKMQALQPEVEDLQAKHKNEPQKLHEAVMRLYQERGVNPLSGILFAIPQAATLYMVFLAVGQYHAQFRNGSFLWIGSPWAIAHPALAAGSLAAPDLLLLIAYAISMVLTQRPAPTADPVQQQTQAAMRWFLPAVACIMIWLNHTASAFVLYWLIGNVISAAIQAYTSRAPHATAA